MAYTFDEAFYRKYRDAIYMAIDKKGDSFTGKARMEDIGGEYTFFDVMGSITATAASGGYSQATPLMEPEHTKRVLVQTDNHAAVRVGKYDEAKAMIDVKSAYVRRLGEALAKKRDIAFITGALKTTTVGKDLGSTATFDWTNQVIAVGTGSTGATGLNVAKLRAIRAKFWANGYTDEKIYLAVSGQQIADLLSETEVGSADYNTIKTLVNGEVGSFMGIELVQCERLPFLNTANNGVHLTWDANDKPVDTDSTQDRCCFAWAEEAVVYGMNPNLITRVSERDDLSYAWQAYAGEGCGAVRLEEAGVVAVPCYEG